MARRCTPRHAPACGLGGSFSRLPALRVVRSAPLRGGVAWRGLDAGRAGTPRAAPTSEPGHAGRHVPCAPGALPDHGAPSMRATGMGAVIMVLRRRLF